ncbi:MAG: hypothetical protein JXR51_06365 [Bacteroidales bacterium]|nr:hypothetical protein [Bacteroidales bacterium]MBN2756785.1 hypothetical protein [Bacteroidales bacterium]
MRIWSIHPKYLDVKGLVALWRETLLAKNVLEGNTKGYKNHPQLKRFKNSENALNSINQYLKTVYEEAIIRGYNFNKNKFNTNIEKTTITVTTGQIKYEFEHLLKKLQKREPEKFQKLSNETKIECHPLFKIIEGEIEDWEII